MSTALPVRVLAGLACFAGGLALLCLGYAVADLRPFELPHLGRLLGTEGLLFVLALVAGLAGITMQMLRCALTGSRLFPRSRTARIGLLAWLALVGWLADWTFRERPLTFEIQVALAGSDARASALEVARAAVRADGSLEAIQRFAPKAETDAVAIMVARIRANRPGTYGTAPVGRVIADNAERFKVSPILLLHWTYIDSFYGESPPGPMPFFAEINPEMFRDLVQAHLPWWFVESPIRKYLIDSRFLDFAGPTIGTKLRYAVQKACYDIAISPFMNSVYSDLFLVLREYRREFPEIFGEGSIDPDLRDSFLALEGAVLRPPYDDPYAHADESGAYYEQHRGDLITFSRAAVYRLAGDYGFATKVQALVARRYSDEYAARLGADTWNRLSSRQQTALLAMLRDVYVPNIGRTSSNLYLVPELNLTPIAYLAAEASTHASELEIAGQTWVPQDRARLWGATGLMLRVLAEVWLLTTGTGLPGVIPADTIADSLEVLAIQ